MGERSVRNAKVGSSILLRSTKSDFPSQASCTQPLDQFEMKTGDFSLGDVREGLNLKRKITVGEDRVITFMGEELRVYETPSMIADVEYACRDLLFENLPDGWDSVGALVDIEHLAATPLGEFVVVSVTIEVIDRRRVRFACEVSDSAELVGKGIHDRFIVNVERHKKRVMDKRVAMRRQPDSVRSA